MSTLYKVWDFPTFPISKQLFYVPGAAVDGGFTSGGARITSPEPGGFSKLQIQPSLQIGEWTYPLSSWLMSKTNGQILRVRLAPTPQVAGNVIYSSVPWGNPDSPWSNNQNWVGDLVASYLTEALQGSNVVVIDMSQIGQVLQRGHVIGHQNVTYLVDDISYDGLNIATVSLTPPLRANVEPGDLVYFRPWFTGSIDAGSDFLTTYDAENVGNIQIGTMTLTEVVLP